MFIDAVHYAPHGPIDVRALDCDFLACSPYKFFGPHMGRFTATRAAPALSSIQGPPRASTSRSLGNGTQTHEASQASPPPSSISTNSAAASIPAAKDRRSALLSAYKVTRQHEMTLLAQLIDGLLAIPGLQFFRIIELRSVSPIAAPTISVCLGNHKPIDIAKYLGERGIFTWDGNYYALNLTERLGVEEKGGLLRVGIVHYNTADEVDRLLAALKEIAAR